MKVLSIIVLIIIFPLFFLAIFGLSIKFTVQKPGFIKKELIEQKAYAKVNKNLAEVVYLFEESKDKGEKPMLTNAELASLLRKTLTADVLRQNTEIFLDGNGKKQDSTVMQKQVTANMTKIIEEKFNTLPVCTSKTKEGDMSCRPPGVKFKQILDQLPTQGNSTLFSANKISPTVNPEKSQGGQSQKDSSTSPLSTIVKLTNLTYVLPFILIFIIFFLARGFAGNWLGAGKVFGIFLAILSALSLLINFLLSFFNKPLASSISDFANKLPKLKSELIVPLFNDILDKINQMTNRISLGFLSVGIVLFIVFIIISLVNKKHPVSKQILNNQ